MIMPLPGGATTEAEQGRDDRDSGADRGISRHFQADPIAEHRLDHAAQEKKLTKR
jgi:hypothetical protein